jgi:hypothetical protein
MTTTCRRWYPVPIPGTSGADHLAHEVIELLPAYGYSSSCGALAGWQAACRRANERRASLGYSPVSRQRVRAEYLPVPVRVKGGDDAG